MSTSFGTANDATAAIASKVVSILKSFPLRSEYRDEQKDLQPHIVQILRESDLPNLQIVVSVGECGGKPSVNLFGTSF